MSNAGTGAFVSFTCAVIVAFAPFHPTLSVTVRFTLNNPGLVKVQSTIRPVLSVTRSPLKSHAYPESRIFPSLLGLSRYARSDERAPSKRTVIPSSTLSFMPFALPAPVRFVWIRATGSWSSAQIVMLRKERLPPPSRIVRFTMYWPDCRYLYCGWRPQPVAFGVKRQVKLLFEAGPFGSKLSPALNVMVVLLAT